LNGEGGKNRGDDGLRREKQLLIDFLCAATGGPLLYVGRDIMKTSHKGMGIDEGDWRTFIGHLDATLESFKASAGERTAVLAFIDSTKRDIVE